MNKEDFTKFRYICDKCLAQLNDLLQTRLTRWETQCKVLDMRWRVLQLREAVTDSAVVNQNCHDALMELKASNTRRELRLKKVREKNLREKQDRFMEECKRQFAITAQRRDELKVLRKRVIQRLYERVFTIEVEPLSREDTGEDYKQLSRIDCNNVVEVDDDWLLSGTHKVPAPNIRIVTASLPSDGDYSAYIIAARQYRHRKLRLDEKDDNSRMREVIDPRTLLEFSVPAALSFVAHFTGIIASILHEPLPYPMAPTTAQNSSNHMSPFVYGNPDRKVAEFKMSLAKLDDNIMYLCFSQGVPLSALTPGHTLENLLALITHSELGRSEPFECYPEYMRYSGSTIEDDVPSVSYVSDSAALTEDGESEEGGEDQPSTEDIDWEQVEPPSLLDMVANRDPLSPQRAEIPDSYRERMMHLDYNSTYRDYAALGASEMSPPVVSSGSDASMKQHPEDSNRAHGSLFGKLSSLLGSFSKPK